jgi:hypothetical protein
LTTTIPWNAQRFPTIYDGDKPTAVIVDLASFEQIEMVMDNLLNRGPEAEDNLIVQSAALRRIAAKVMATAEPLADWERALDENFIRDERAEYQVENTAPESI